MKNDSSKAIGYNLLMINTFIYIAFSFYTPFLSSFYSLIGINAVQIGILLAIGPVVAIFIQPLWAILSDRTGRRKDVLSLVVLGSGCSIFLYYLGHTFITLFIATTLLSVFVTSIIPLSDAIIIRTASKYHFDFAKIRMGGTIGFSIVVIIVGGFIGKNLSASFALGSIGYFILFLIVRRLPREENEGKREKGEHIKETRKKEKDRRGILNIFNTKQVLFVLAFAFICQMGFSFYSGFLGVYLLHLGYGAGTIGIINCVAALSEVPTLLVINKLIKRFGTMKIIIVSCIIMSIRIFIITGGNLFSLYVASLIQGITTMTIYYSCAVFISEHTNKGRQSQGQSTLAIMQTGIGSIVGNILGGFFVNYLGLKSAYMYMAAVVFTASAVIGLIQVIYKRREQLKVVIE